MATSISINGQRTSVPGTAADPRFDSSGRALPQAKTLLVVGQFEQIQNGEPVLVRSAAEMARVAPGDTLLEQVAGLAFNPAADPLVGAPGEILIGSTLPSTPAQAIQHDGLGRDTVVLTSKVSGRYGNGLSHTLVNNGSDPTRRDLTIARHGDTEALPGLGSGPLLDLTYTSGWPTNVDVSVHAPFFDEDLGDVAGRVLLTLRKGMRVGGEILTVPNADRGMTGKVTLSPRPRPLLPATTTVSTDTFTSPGHGLEIGDPVHITDLTGTTIASWSNNHVGYVISDGFSPNTFRIARTPADAQIDLGGVDGAATVRRVQINAVTSLGGVAVTQSTALFTSAGHGLLVGDRVNLSAFSGMGVSGHFPGRVYFVISDGYTIDTFKLSTVDEGAPITILTGNGSCTVTAIPLTFEVEGVTAGGVAVTEIVSAGLGFPTAVSTDASWSRVNEVRVSVSGAGSGLLDLLWTIADIQRQDAATIADLAALLGDRANLSTVVRNARLATMTLADLDSVDSRPLPFSFSANTSEFVRQVNGRSRFVNATRLLPDQPIQPMAPGNVVTDGVSTILEVVEGDPALIDAGDLILLGDPAQPLYTLEVESVAGNFVTVVYPAPIELLNTPYHVVKPGFAGRPAAFSGSRQFTGGTAGVQDSASIEALFDTVPLTDTSVIAVLSYSAPLIAAARAHAIRAAGVGEKECNVWAPIQNTLAFADLEAAVLGLNTRHVSVCAEMIRVIDPAGNRRWLDSRFQALQCAAMQAAVPIGEPVTNKRPRVLETKGGPDWSGQTSADRLIQAGVVSYRRDSLGFVVTRAVTTHLANDDVNQTEVSANESVYWQIRDMREELRAAIGRSSGTFYPTALVALVIARAKRQIDARLIQRFDEDSVFLVQNGDTVVVGYDFAPNVPVNFAVVRPNVRPVRFEFNLT